MPKIARYGGPQARTAVVRGPQARVSPGSTAIAKGLGDLGRGIGQMADQINTTEAREATVKFERAKNDLFFNPESGYFNTQGKSAHDTANDANESLQKLANTYADSMSNPQAREMFMNVANQHVTRGQSDIMRHSTKGLQAWEVSTIKAEVENSLENAALFRGDDEKLSVQNALGRQAVLESAKLEGITGDALNERLQTYESAFASATIDAALLDNAAAGQESLEKYGDKLEGAEKQKFENRIAAAMKSEKDQSDSQEAVRIATKIVGDTDGNKSRIQEALNGIDDEVMRSKVRKEATSQANFIETARTEEGNERFSVADKFVKDSGSIEAYKAAHQDEWDKLSAAQQRKLEKGVTADNDWNTWTDLEAMSNDDIRKMGRGEVDKHSLKLDNSHRDKFIKRWGDLRRGETSKPEAQLGRTRANQTKGAVEQLMDKKASEWNIEHKTKADKFYALLDSEHESRKTQLDRELSSEEFTNMLNGFTHKVVSDRELWFPGVELEDIPEEHLDVLTNELRKFKIPVTSNNLIRAYEQAK